MISHTHTYNAAHHSLTLLTKAASFSHPGWTPTRRTWNCSQSAIIRAISLKAIMMFLHFLMCYDASCINWLFSSQNLEDFLLRNQIGVEPDLGSICIFEYKNKCSKNLDFEVNLTFGILFIVNRNFYYINYLDFWNILWLVFPQKC